MNHLFSGKIKSDRKFHFNSGQREYFTKYVSSLYQGDVDACISIQVIKKKRTLNQNNGYWLRCSILADHFGISKDEMHSVTMQLCNMGELRKVCGIEKYVRESSTKLSTKEFAVLIDKQDWIVFFENEGKDQREWLVIPELEKELKYK